MIPFIITNHNKGKIEIVSEYDEKCNVMRIDVREINSPGQQTSVDNGEVGTIKKTSNVGVNPTSDIFEDCKCGHPKSWHDFSEGGECRVDSADYPDITCNCGNYLKPEEKE